MRVAKQKEMFEILDLRRSILHLRSVCLSPGVGGWVWGGGGVLLYFHAHVGWGYFWGFKILNFNFLGGFQKTEYFWGYEDFVDTFGVITKLDYTMHFRVFSEGQGTKWRIFFWVA